MFINGDWEFAANTLATRSSLPSTMYRLTSRHRGRRRRAHTRQRRLPICPKQWTENSASRSNARRG